MAKFDKRNDKFKDRVDDLFKNYLNKGYFDEEGVIWEELLTNTANAVAKSFGSNMNTSQIRKFYGHVRTAERAYSNHNSDRKFINDIKVLDSFVSEAYAKEKVTYGFYRFIRENVKTANSVNDIKKGFIPHFQAVLAYFTYHYPKSN